MTHPPPPSLLPPARRPFEGAAAISVLLPSPVPGLDPEEVELLELLPRRIAEEATALSRELGAPIIVVPTPPRHGPVWLIGPRALNPHLAARVPSPVRRPRLTLDRQRGLLISDAPDLDGVLETFAGLRSLARLGGGTIELGPAPSLDDALRRVLVEVHDSWAGRHLRPVRWAELSAPHVRRVRGGSTPSSALRAMQAWLAELDDFHTWIRPVGLQLVLPYGAAVVRGEVVLTHVLPWTAGYAAGARPGWRLVGEDVRGVWSTTPAAAHSKPMLVARRLLSGPAGERRHLEARGPGGAWARWTEVFTPPTGAPVDWTILPSGHGYLWIGAWVPGFGVEDAIEEAMVALQRCDRLIVDLRGNAGGRLWMAHAFRDRFLPDRRICGTIRHTEPGGRLGPPEALWGEPSTATRWTRRVRFLTSPLSYSSSEDALLGLAGLPNVQVVGEPSGGGSGRNRRLRLLPGWRLTIATAITYDARGRPVEGQGIPVDRLVNVRRDRPDGSDPVLHAADTLPWG